MPTPSEQLPPARPPRVWRRRDVAALALGAALLLAAVGVRWAWLRSAEWVDGGSVGIGWLGLQAGSAGGSLEASAHDTAKGEPAVWANTPVGFNGPRSFRGFSWSLFSHPNPWSRSWSLDGGGFSAGYIRADGSKWGYGVAHAAALRVPYWFVFALAAAAGPGLLLIGLRRVQRRRIRRRDGLCVGCGYDLRASTGRCPECGAVSSPLT